MTYTGVAAGRALRRVALASIATAASAPGVARAGGYSVAVFHGNSFRGTSLGMTGDGINAGGDIVGESPVILQVSGQLLGSNHGVELKAGDLLGEQAAAQAASDDATGAARCERRAAELRLAAQAAEASRPGHPPSR